MSMSDSTPAYLALAVVVVGWFVANFQANRREDRKEARALVDRAKLLAEGIAKDAIDYLASPDSALAPKLKADLDLLEIELSRLPNFDVRSAPLISRLTHFQEAVTGGDFETADRPGRGAGSYEVRAVMTARNELMWEMERQFRAYYL